MAKASFEIWLAFNEDGNPEVSIDDAVTAREAVVENSGGECIRTVKIIVHATLPEVVDAEVDVPDEAGETVAAEPAE